MLPEQVPYYEEYKRLRKSPEENAKRLSEIEEFLVVANKGLIYKMARRYPNLKDAPVSDVEAFGMVAIMKAIRTFDETKGSFVAHVGLHLISSHGLQGMSRFVSGGSLNLPHNAHQQYMKEKREILSTGMKLSETEIFDKLSPESQAMEIALHKVSRFSAVDIGSREARDIEVEQDTFHSPEDETIQIETSRLLFEAINELPEREREVILHMAGLDETVDPLTLREVGDLMKLSHERIRQIRDKALGRLKKKLGCKLSELLSECVGSR